MLRNQATALIRHEHLTTTVPKAKELRPFVERLITVAKRGVATGEAKGAGAAGTGAIRVLNARRLVMRDLVDQQIITKLFDDLAPRFAARPGGYTRLLRLGFRKGDSAELAQVEFVGSEFDPKAKAEAPAGGEAKPKATGVGGRLRAAADRLRGKKDVEGHPEGDKAAKGAGGKGAPKSRPRKQGAKGS
jgi:large subunit ribosomal protein L17